MIPNNIAGPLKKIVRRFLSLAPKIKAVPSAASFREPGLSAFVRVKNEEYWIRPCLTSICRFVDEIVVVDNGSTDSTLAVVKEVGEEIDTPIRIHSRPDLDHCQISNIAIAECRYRWLLKWDADFIAHTSGKQSFKYLRDYIMQLDPDCYYMVFMQLVNLAGDLRHQPLDRCSVIRSPGQVHKEAYLWSYMPDIYYRWNDYKGISKVESLIFPHYFRFLEWPGFSVFHVGGIRSMERMIVDHFWHQWKYLYAGKPKDPGGISRESFAWERAKQKFGTDDREEIVRRFFGLLKKDLIPYAEDRFGTYPDTLLPYLQDPKYRLLYDASNRITARQPDVMA